MTSGPRADDRAAITETVHRYATGVDTRDWDLYRSIFDERVTIDFSSYSGRPAAEMGGDEWVASVRPLFTGLAATQHQMSNAIVELDGDEAVCWMYMVAVHVGDHDEPSRRFTIGGRYRDALRRSEDGPAGWVITAVTLEVWWRDGDAAVMAEAVARGASGAPGGP